MKKVLSIILILVILISLSGMTALASNGRGHGNGGGHGKGNGKRVHVRTEQQNAHQSRNSQQPRNAKQQDGLALCPEQECTTRGIHEHDGVYYHCSNYETRSHCGSGSGRSVGNGGRLRDGSCRNR